jgi:hypothetical protein
MDDYSSAFHETERLMILMEEHRIQMPERNRMKVRETQTLLIDTKKAMVEAFEGSQSYKMSFKKELIETEIPKLQRKIDEMRKQLCQEGVFGSDDTPVEEAVLKLETIGQNVIKAKERGV